MEIRLNKYISQAGICSRRDADRLIEAGKVTVNGRRADKGMKVEDRDRVAVNGKNIGAAVPARVVLAYYKPIGVTCTERDKYAEKTLGDVIRYPVRVTYAGRLDKESEGLLLLTNDGALIEEMMGGTHGHEKEYVVKTDRELTGDFLQKMKSGVFLRELAITTRPCRISREGKYTFRIVLTQGVNRQIRRMCKELGYQVKSLKRIRVINIGLGNLKPGEYREVTGEELRELYDSCRLKPVF